MAAFARHMWLFFFSLTWLLFLTIAILWIFEFMKPSASVERALSYFSMIDCVCLILTILCLFFKRLVSDFEIEEDESRQRRLTNWAEFYENIQKARLAFASLIVLPPVKIFKDGDGTKDDCAVCLEEFEVGESIQPFPCKHEFYASCINSWLHAGNITCPVCRFSLKDLLKARGFYFKRKTIREFN